MCAFGYFLIFSLILTTILILLLICATTQQKSLLQLIDFQVQNFFNTTITTITTITTTTTTDSNIVLKSQHFTNDKQPIFLQSPQ